MRKPMHITGHQKQGASWSFSTACNARKETMRSQIHAHIEEFLRHGGQIKVVDNGASGQAAEGKVSSNIGSVWHGQDELQSFIDQDA